MRILATSVLVVVVATFCLLLSSPAAFVRASLELPDIAQTFDAYDFFGETNLSDFVFRDAALLRLRFGPNCDILTDDTTKQLGSLWPASAPRPAQTVAFADYGEMSNVRCGSYSDVLVRLHRVAADLTQKRGLPPVVLTVFAAGEPSTKVFGSAEAEPLDDYWTKRPAGMRTALVAKDTGDLLLQLFDVGGKLPNGSSVPAQPVLRVNAIHDEGPWNRFLHSTYFKVEGIINYILFGASCLFAIYMLVKAFINGTWTRWLKTLLLINAIYFMVVSITCPQRGPLTNAQLTAQFTAWMVCGATTNLTLLKWASFMRVVFKDKPLLYRGLLGVTVTNIMVWTVAMLTMIAGLYVSDLNVGMVGGLLFTIVAPILFVTLSIYTLALAILYKKRLHKMRISSITKALLYRVTYLMTVFFAGWLLISLCALFLGTGLTYNITWFCIGNAVYTVGVFVLFTGILIILDLADRIQDRGSLRSITNPTGPGSGYHGAVSANASQLGDTLRGSALTGSLSRSHPSRLRSASTKINASGNGLGQSRMSVTDNDDILIGDSIQLGNGNTNSSRIHTNENDGYRPHSVPHRINSPPSMTPLLGEKMHYNVESLSSYNHEYPPSHSPGLPQHLHQQQHSQHSQQTRVHNDQFDDLLSPTYSSDPRQFATPGQVTLVPLDSTDHNYGSGVRFDPLGQRY